MKKPRSDNKLLNLPEEQQAQLADWLLSGIPYHEAKKLVEKEFNVCVSLSAFSGFWSAVCADELLRRRRRAVNCANDVAMEAEKNPARFDAATVEALRQKAFELAISPGANPKDVKAIFALVLKARDQDLDQEQLKLDREKFELLKAKAEQADAAKEVTSNAALTPEQKQAEYRRIFGMS